MKIIETPIQMRFDDVDQLGHVNNTRLQSYFDVGKIDWFAGVLPGPIDWRGRQIMIQRAANTEFLAQTRFGEPVAVRTELEKVGTTSLTLFQRIVNTATGEIKATNRAVMVMFDMQAQQKIAVPDAWREAFGG